MNEITKTLVPAVVSCVEETGGYVTKTKLLKILYLLDVEFYRLHRQTLTGFDWKFFHLGPWTDEFGPLLENLVATGILVERAAAKPEYEAKFYHVAQPHDFGKLIKAANDEFSLKRVLNTWAESSTGEILDYVYFHTEPMERGVRNQRLDFSYISELPVERYTRPASGISTKQIRKLRAEFQGKRGGTAPPVPTTFTLPRYDEEFRSGIAKLDQTEN